MICELQGKVKLIKNKTLFTPKEEMEKLLGCGASPLISACSLLISPASTFQARTAQGERPAFQPDGWLPTRSFASWSLAQVTTFASLIVLCFQREAAPKRGWTPKREGAIPILRCASCCLPPTPQVPSVKTANQLPSCCHRIST